MPHYENGELARIGDIVEGVGYNIKHRIIGMVVNIREGESCTLSVACVCDKSLLSIPYNPYTKELSQIDKPFTRLEVTTYTEYGDTKCFNKIFPNKPDGLD